ncbi:MAG: CHASE2 domain-containing protein [Chthoniobacterales bacterium]
MQRPSPWFMLVVLLLGILFQREPRFAQFEERFLNWMVRHSAARGGPVPLTVVEIGVDPLLAVLPSATPGPALPTESAVTPLEYALFLQSLLDFQPGVVAFENILKWRARDQAQEQVFLDQAMRVPKLLLASELGTNTDPDAPWSEIRGLPDVRGKRGDLPAFSGVVRQPSEDLRLIATTGYVNFPAEISSDIRVPLLFLYRGEIIPSFPLQAILLSQKVTPAEVKVVLGSYIELPHGRRIPIGHDGTLLIHPNAGAHARRITLNELLVAAQEKEKGSTTALADLHDQIVLARTPANPLSPPDLFAATIATIQGGFYLRRVSPVFDYAILIVIALCAGLMRNVGRIDLLLCGIAATAAYCLVALGTISRWNIWLPGVLPMGALWIAIVLGLFLRRASDSRTAPSDLPPPLA